MKFYNVGIDEDSRACIDIGDDITKFEYRGHIGEQGMCGCHDLVELPQNFEDIVNEDIFLQNDKQGKKERKTLVEHFDKLLSLYNEHGGILLTWAVEYDQNWLLIYDCTVEEFKEWYNREIDESEFDD